MVTSRKEIAGKAYEATLRSALSKVMMEFKRRATAVRTPSSVWEIEDYPREQRREIDEVFDYRSSRLPVVFACLIREGHLEERLLDGLLEEKRDIIRSLLAHAARS